MFLCKWTIRWFIITSCVSYYCVTRYAAYIIISVCCYVLLLSCWGFFYGCGSESEVRFCFLFFPVMSRCNAGPTCLLGVDLHKDGAVSNSCNETEDVSKINPCSVDEACLPAKHACMKTAVVTALPQKCFVHRTNSHGEVTPTLLFLTVLLSSAVSKSRVEYFLRTDS